MYTSIHDTIVAISSAPGHAPRGIVRLSGPAALTLAHTIFVCEDKRNLAETAGFEVRTGRIVFDEAHAVPATAYLFRAPRSYTHQDLVELHTIGSPAVLNMVIDCCLAGGARPAEPGEFTARAYLSGAMSLADAEGVAATIQARSDQQLRAARRMMRGDLADAVRRWQDELADLLSLVVADIDFAEEPIDFIAPPRLRARISALGDELDEIMRSAADRERSDVLPQILLLGPPNAGKSTLLNALSGVDRAIASAVSGTTRDVLSEPVRLGALEAIMLDTAGVDNDPGEIVAAGRLRALATAAEVEAVCLVFDGTGPVDRSAVTELAAHAASPTLVVVNKVDRLDAAAARGRVEQYASCDCGQVCLVSATTGAGLDALRSSLADLLAAEHRPAETTGLLLSARQRAVLLEAAAALGRAAQIVGGAGDTLDVAELIAFELREALTVLGTIHGAVSTEDLLGRIFSNFCIGK